MKLSGYQLYTIFHKGTNIILPRSYLNVYPTTIVSDHSRESIWNTVASELCIGFGYFSSHFQCSIEGLMLPLKMKYYRNTLQSTFRISYWSL